MILMGVENCLYCQDKVYKDRLCASHWQAAYGGMRNKDRMQAKRAMRVLIYQRTGVRVKNLGQLKNMPKTEEVPNEPANS